MLKWSETNKVIQISSRLHCRTVVSRQQNSTSSALWPCGDIQPYSCTVWHVLLFPPLIFSF
jgi:hypothetical protein